MRRLHHCGYIEGLLILTLSGLEKLADRPLSEFGSISARYEISKGELTITDIQMDKVPKSGRIVLGPSNCG